MKQNNSPASLSSRRFLSSWRSLLHFIWNDTFIYTLIAIFCGLLAGSVVLLVTGFNPLNAYSTLFAGIFGSPKNLIYTLQYAAPIIMTGLSVTFAFKTGLFNIGAEGQYIVGGIASLAVSLLVSLPPPLHGIVCVLAGAAAGALWGGIAGLLKAYKGIHEVIVTIMLNWIAFYLSNFIVMSPRFKKPNSTASLDISESSRIWTDAFINMFGPVKIHWGMLLSVAAVFVCAVILNKTTLGYKLRACGFNRDAAKYGGIPVERSIVTSMAISGLLAGLGGAIQLMGVQGRITQLGALEGYGFDGISVSMIGGINPIGVLFSGIFYGGLKYGSGKLNVIGAPSELVNVIIGVIIYSIAIMGAFRTLINFFKKTAKKESEKKNERNAAQKESEVQNECN